MAHTAKRKNKRKGNLAKVRRQNRLEVAPPPTQSDLVEKDAGFRRRIIALAVVVGVILLIFIIRLVQFQLVNGGSYLSQATSGQPPSSQSLSQSGEG